MYLITVRTIGAQVRIDLGVMGLERVSEQQGVRTTVLPLLNGAWAVQQRGADALRRRFSGSLPVRPEGRAAAKVAFDQLRSVQKERLRLYEDVTNPLAFGYVIGTVTLEAPDVIDGKPVLQRWRFEFVEEAG